MTYYTFNFRCASRLLAWMLSQIMGASVGFRIGGWKCLRDVVIKFKKVLILLQSLGSYIVWPKISFGESMLIFLLFPFFIIEHGFCLLGAVTLSFISLGMIMWLFMWFLSSFYPKYTILLIGKCWFGVYGFYNNVSG